MSNDTNNDNHNLTDDSGVPPKQIQMKLPFEEEDFMISENQFNQKSAEWNDKLAHRVESQQGETVTFFHPDRNGERITVGYNRGIGPLFFHDEPWEVPVGFYMDNGDYWGFKFNLRILEDKPSFRIGDVDYYNKIISVYQNCGKVDPKTGNLLPPPGKDFPSHVKS